MTQAAITPELQRQLAVNLFNRVWELLEKTDRTRQEDDEMLHGAHASCYHWSKVGTPVNLVRGEWQISRVYSVLKRAEPAQYHAQRSLALALEHNISDFDLAFAFEALARAAMVAEDEEEMRRYLESAREAGNNIAEADDKQVFDADLATITLEPSSKLKTI